MGARAPMATVGQLICAAIIARLKQLPKRSEFRTVAAMWGTSAFNPCQLQQVAFAQYAPSVEQAGLDRIGRASGNFRDFLD